MDGMRKCTQCNETKAVQLFALLHSGGECLTRGHVCIDCIEMEPERRERLNNSRERARQIMDRMGLIPESVKRWVRRCEQKYERHVDCPTCGRAVPERILRDRGPNKKVFGVHAETAGDVAVAHLPTETS